MNTVRPDGRADCSVDGCDRPVEKAGLCAGHRKRKNQRRTVDGQLQMHRGLTPFEVLLEAAIRCVDADPNDDAEWVRARNSLRYAAISYATRTSREEPATPDPLGNRPGVS